MKRFLSRSQLARYNSFTLVELLVVIGIIAILAATTLQVGGLMIKKAKQAKAANTATQIQTAVLGYYTEYSVYPVPSTTSGDYYIADTGNAANQSAWGNLICILCGNVEPASPLTTFTPTSITNSRGIAFLTLKSTDVDGGNAPLNPLPGSVSGSTTNNAYFSIAINSSYSGVLGTNSPSNVMPNFGSTFSSSGGGTSTAGVAVWANCNGPSATTNAAWYVHTY